MIPKLWQCCLRKPHKFSLRSSSPAARFTLPEPLEDGDGQCAQPQPPADSPQLDPGQEGSIPGGRGRQGYSGLYVTIHQTATILLSISIFKKSLQATGEGKRQERNMKFIFIYMIYTLFDIYIIYILYLVAVRNKLRLQSKIYKLSINLK